MAAVAKKPLQKKKENREASDLKDWGACL